MTRTYQTIRLETGAGIARLTLNRPERHNALNSTMIREISSAAAVLAGDARVRAVVLSAAGNSFCAGADLAWMREQFAADRDARIAEASRLATMLRLLDELPKLLIGVIAGPVYGGGIGLVSVCDIVLATPEAKFALTETRLGLIPATIVPFLVRCIGNGNLRRIGLTGNPFGADEARAMGLVAEVHESTNLGAALDRHLDRALTSAPGAIAAAKRLFRRVASGTVSQAETVVALADRWESEEARNGLDAFFEKRRPPWAP